MTPPTEAQLEDFGGMLLPSDLLTTTAVAYGTTYAVDNVVVTKVHSCDVITVGVIQHVVMRKTRLLFVTTLHDAARTEFSFFRACPNGQVDCVDHKKLSDHKPLVKRDGGINFRFLLHHHLPTPLD